ncbi:MAG TPA: DHA2 family efflux MFS transporter permease subunit [Alcanivoracaceae bacterium]|nr:DHA2 family efflux MFS transporter permease subunit [Alcanivoracaceae bacterium]
MASAEALSQRYGVKYRWLALCTVTVGALATILSSTIANMAIPAVMLDFGIEQDVAHWLTTGFLTSVPVGMLLSGWLIDRWGQRAILLNALGVFVVTSLFAAQSSSFIVLAIYRVMQGFSAGIVQPLSLLTIFHVFPLKQRGLAIGMYGFGAIIGPASAPVLGGVLVDVWSWPAIFLVAVPIVLITMLLAVFFIPSTKSEEGNTPFDWVGLGLLLVVWCLHLWWLTVGFAYPLWPQLFLLLASLLGLMLFIKQQLASPYPLLALRVFKHSLFSIGFVLSVVMGIGLFASTYVAALFFQQVLEKSATEAGLMLLPAGFVMALMFPISGHLSDRWPFYRLMNIGLILFAAAMLGMALTPVAGSIVLWIAWVALGRLALSVLMPALSTTPLNILSTTQLSQGSGIINFARQWGAVVGVAATAIFIQFVSESSPYWADESTRILAYERGFYASFVVLAGLNLFGLLLCFYTMRKWPQPVLARHE